MLADCSRYCAAALILLAPASAAAQDDESMTVAQKKVAARTKGEEGFALFEEGKWQEAYVLFSEAEATFHTPSFVLYMARCQRKLGKLLEARAQYFRVLNERFPASVPRPFKEAQTDAAGEMEALETVIPSIQVVVEGVSTEAVRVRINGVITSIWSDGVELNPGFHVIEVAAEGMVTAVRAVTLSEGTPKSLVIELSPHPDEESAPAPVAPTPAGSSGAPVADGGVPQSSTNILGTLSLCAGGVGIVVGAVTGLLSIDKHADPGDYCTTDLQCWQNHRSKTEEAETLGAVSIASLIAGGVGLSLGTVLFLSDSDPKAAVKASISPWLGAGYAGAKGTF